MSVFRRCWLMGIVVLMASCAKSQKDLIVGAWHEEGGKEVVEFFKDGTMSVNGAIVGDYSFLDERRIKLNLTGWGVLAGPQMFTADVNKTVLALTDSRGKTSAYSRAMDGPPRVSKGSVGAEGSSRPAGGASTSKKDQAVVEFEKVMREFIAEAVAKLDEKGLKELAGQFGQARDKLKNTSVEALTLQSREGETKGSLGALRSAMSIFYGDTEGHYPAELDQLTKNGKYLTHIPMARTGMHSDSNSVVFACGPNQLKDTGGWAYCNKKQHKDFGSVGVDCTHRDSRGTEWFKY